MMSQSLILFLFIFLLNFVWEMESYINGMIKKKSTGFLVLSNKLTLKAFLCYVCVQRGTEGDTNISFRYVICIYSNMGSIN